MEERYNSSDLSQNWRTIVLLSIPFDAFRIFGFLDDTGFRTTAPGITSRRIYGFLMTFKELSTQHTLQGMD